MKYAVVNLMTGDEYNEGFNTLLEANEFVMNLNDNHNYMVMEKEQTVLKDFDKWDKAKEALKHIREQVEVESEENNHIPRDTASDMWNEAQCIMNICEGYMNK